MPRYPEDLITAATEEGHALFSVEVSGETCRPNEVGKQALVGSIEQEDALRLMLFFRLVRKGITVRAAFAEAFPPETGAKPGNKTLSVDDLFPNRVQ